MPKKQGGHAEEHENEEAWVIPYADMLTLLMAMFLVLYAMSNLNNQKFKDLSIAFHAVIAGDKVVDAGLKDQGGDAIIEGGTGGILDGGAISKAVKNWPISNVVNELSDGAARTEADQALEQLQQYTDAVKAEQQQEATIQQQVEQKAGELGLGDHVKVEGTGDGLKITLVSDATLFSSGSADVQPGGQELLAEVAKVLGSVPNDIRIEGHTDDTPLTGGRYGSNYLLSAARAESVRNVLLADAAIAPERVSIGGYGPDRPIADNSTGEGRAANRRVEITILSMVKGPVVDTGTTDTSTPTTETTAPGATTDTTTASPAPSTTVVGETGGATGLPTRSTGTTATTGQGAQSTEGASDG